MPKVKAKGDFTAYKLLPKPVTDKVKTLLHNGSVLSATSNYPKTIEYSTTYQAQEEKKRSQKKKIQAKDEGRQKREIYRTNNPLTRPWNSRALPLKKRVSKHDYIVAGTQQGLVTPPKRPFKPKPWERSQKKQSVSNSAHLLTKQTQKSSVQQGTPSLSTNISTPLQLAIQNVSNIFGQQKRDSSPTNSVELESTTSNSPSPPPRRYRQPKGLSRSTTKVKPSTALAQASFQSDDGITYRENPSQIMEASRHINPLIGASFSIEEDDNELELDSYMGRFMNETPLPLHLQKVKDRKTEARDSGRDTLVPQVNRDLPSLTSTPFVRTARPDAKNYYKTALPDWSSLLDENDEAPSLLNEFMAVAPDKAQKIVSALNAEAQAPESQSDNVLELDRDKQNESDVTYFPNTSTNQRKLQYEDKFPVREKLKLPTELRTIGRDISRCDDIQFLRNFLILLNGTEPKNLEYEHYNLPPNSKLYKETLKHFLTSTVKDRYEYLAVKEGRIDLQNPRTKEYDVPEFIPNDQLKVFKEKLESGKVLPSWHKQNSDSEQDKNTDSKILQTPAKVPGQAPPNNVTDAPVKWKQLEAEETFESSPEKMVDGTTNDKSFDQLQLDKTINPRIDWKQYSLKTLMAEAMDQKAIKEKNTPTKLLDEDRNEKKEVYDAIFFKAQQVMSDEIKTKQGKANILATYLVPQTLKSIVKNQKYYREAFLDLFTSKDRQTFSQRAVKFYELMHANNLGQEIPWKQLAVYCLMFPDLSDPRYVSNIELVGNESVGDQFKNYYQL